MKNVLYTSSTLPLLNDECETKSFMLEYRYKAYEPGVKEKVVNMAINGSGIRDTSRVLGINKKTVINTLKNSKAFKSSTDNLASITSGLLIHCSKAQNSGKNEKRNQGRKDQTMHLAKATAKIKHSDTKKPTAFTNVAGFDLYGGPTRT